jgi:hypothetical protein
MRDLTALGARPFGKNRPFPAFAESALREFELAFHVQLPAEFVRFLRFANGGALELCVYDDPSGGIGGINDFYGIGRREDDNQAATGGSWEYGNLWGETRAFRQYQFQGSGIPFATDGGGNKLFLDYREESPCVSRLIAATLSTYRVAASFEKFLDMLRGKTFVPDRKPREVKIWDKLS